MLTASSTNKQPVRYLISNNAEKNERIYKYLRSAGPEENEKPSAYIVTVEPKKVNVPHDEGIIEQTILLAAVEEGLGGCLIANIDRGMLKKSLNVDDRYDIKLVIALGCPKEKVVLEDISETDGIKYYRDEEKIRHIPQIKLEDLFLNN